MPDKRTILIAGMGTSPAVLTETVWALCHQKKPMVPDEIVVLVTKSGKERLCAELLSGDESVWEKMLAALKKEKIKIDGKLVFGETSIRVIPDERGNGVWDLRSGEDNLRAASTICARRFPNSARNSNPPVSPTPKPLYPSAATR